MPDGATLTIEIDREAAERLAELAAEQGVTVEALASEAVRAFAEDAEGGEHSALTISNEEYAASILRIQKQLADGTAVLSEHDDVIAEARAILARGRGA